MGLSLAKPKVLERDDYRCRYCGDLAETVDHIVPLYRWPRKDHKRLPGANSKGNLVACCHSCNHFKDSLLLEETTMFMLRPGTRISQEGAARIRSTYRILRPHTLRHLRRMLEHRPELLQLVPLDGLKEYEHLQKVLKVLNAKDSVQTP